MPRRLVRLLVPSPDRRRVLARPNGLAGWSLPIVPLAEGEDMSWTDELVTAVGRVVGAPVRPVRELADGAWEMEALGRIPSTGAAWIAPDEAGRLGVDAAVLVQWAADEG